MNRPASGLPFLPRPELKLQQGMVLIAVLWMVAALGILVTGMTRSVREEARTLTLARQSVEGTALGDAAIQLVLQEMVSKPGNAVAGLVQVQKVYQGVSMEVQVVPLNGLIDLNSAPEPLLNSLYLVAGGLTAERASLLAQSTVQARQQRDARGAQKRFEAPEDLLQIQGIDFPLYARLSGLVTADLSGTGKVSPLAAPLGVLTVLAAGNTEVADRIAQSRLAGVAAVDTTALDAAFVQNTSVRRFRVQARVPLADGTWLSVSRSVDLDARGRAGLPWHTFHTRHSIDPVLRQNP